MKILNEQEKRDALQQLLIDLSKSQDVLKDKKNRREFYLRLEDIYYNQDAENYRHFYSDIFACLSLIDADSSLGNLDILAQNMEVIKEGYVPININEKNNEPIDIRKEIIKLYDHTNLDISRINYTKRLNGETQSELANTEILINDLKKRLSDADAALNQATKHFNEESENLKNTVHDSQKKMQNEYITILGIFASIVLAFTGGMTFSGSVLENIHKASCYRILAIVLVLGLILFNLMWLLIDFLRDINGKSIRKWWISILANGFIICCLIFTFILYRDHLLDTNAVYQTTPTQDCATQSAIVTTQNIP